MTAMQSETSTTEKTEGLLGHSLESLKARFGVMKEPGFRAAQVMRWVHEAGVTAFGEMTNLSVGLRTRLGAEFHIYEAETVADRCSDDGTRKLLLRWADGNTTECVLIPDGVRRTACISTQVGCPVGCVFCASGLGGLERQLTTAQIIEQAMLISRLAGSQRLSNIVFMGLGEPLHNYEATLAAVRVLNAPWGLNIGARKITISTVGLPKQIARLAEENLQITLAISLHAPNDELRRQIIPWAESISIDSLVKAANYYFERTGRETTLEYILLGGLNDQPHHAGELADVARRMRSNVNLIRYNPVEGLPYQRPASAAAAKFQSLLRDRGINCHIRRSRGLDIDGACGQLRRRQKE